MNVYFRFTHDNAGLISVNESFLILAGAVVASIGNATVYPSNAEAVFTVPLTVDMVFDNIKIGSTLPANITWTIDVSNSPDFSSYNTYTFNSNVQTNEQLIPLSSAELFYSLQNLPIIVANYNTAQQAVIASLSLSNRNIFATGTTAQKNALIATLTTAQQATFAVVSIYSQTVEQQAADKLAIEQIVYKLKNGSFISDNDGVLLALGNSLMANAAMQIVDAGGGFNELRNAGLSSQQALRVLSIYNVTIDTNKYESEVKLGALENDPTLMQSLSDYLAAQNPPLSLPPITPYLAQIRADHAVYSAIKNWTGA